MYTLAPLPFRRTGILVFGPANSVSVAETAKSLASNGIFHEAFSGEEANKRYPHQLKLPANSKCVFEKDGGILFANKALAAFQVCCMPCSCYIGRAHRNVYI